MAVEHLADGVKIGPDSSGNDRLPIYDFDEWTANIPEFTLAAGAQTTLVVQNVTTVRQGSRVIASPMNPQSYNMDKLSVVHAWASNNGEISVMVRNHSSSSVTYGEDQWQFTYLCTLTPPSP